MCALRAAAPIAGEPRGRLVPVQPALRLFPTCRASPMGTPQNWFDSDSWYPLGRVIGGTV